MNACIVQQRALLGIRAITWSIAAPSASEEALVKSWQPKAVLW